MMTVIELPKPDQFPEFTWRAPRRSDAAAMHRMDAAIEQVDKRGYIDSEEECERTFEDRGSNPETDALFAFTAEGEIAARGWVFSPPGASVEYVAFLWGEVHPDYRGRGLGRFLVTWMEARARQILVARPTDLLHFIRTSASEQLTDRVALFEQLGFEPVRYFYRMHRDLSLPISEPVLPEGLVLCNWTPELDPATLDAFNESFQDHWGYIPLEIDDWRLYVTGSPNFRPEFSYVILTDGKDGQPQELVAFSVNQTRQNQLADSSEEVGWVQDLGVRRAWRKQGLATTLLCVSLQSFKDAGYNVGGLGVDTENLTGALRIYERLGFKPVRRGITFSKQVD
jgi:mycothiol synthase